MGKEAQSDSYSFRGKAPFLWEILQGGVPVGEVTADAGLFKASLPNGGKYTGRGGVLSDFLEELNSLLNGSEATRYG